MPYVEMPSAGGRSNPFVVARPAVMPRKPTTSASLRLRGVPSMSLNMYSAAATDDVSRKLVVW